jgi:hypothetical protein
MNQSQRLRPSRLTLAATLLASLTSFTLHAQQHSDADTTATNTAVATAPATNIFAVPNMDLAADAGVNYSSSRASTDVTVDLDAVDHLDLGANTQPPPRRRYGRPRYNDSNHNSDGSNKYEFEVGAGMTGPIGNTYHYLNTSWAFQVGGGRDFNKHFGVLLQFDYDHFGFNGRTLYNQAQLYNYGLSTSSPYYLTGLDGSSHVWSFTLDPHYNFAVSEGFGAYVVGGAGFFHKTANFTVPATGTYCDYYYGCYQYSANSTIDKYTSNAPGVNGGAGLTFKPSRFGGERLFVEGRYNLMFNQQKKGITVFSPTATLNSYTGNNYYPANSNRTTWLSFKAGLRF